MRERPLAPCSLHSLLAEEIVLTLADICSAHNSDVIVHVPEMQWKMVEWVNTVQDRKEINSLQMYVIQACNTVASKK